MVQYKILYKLNHANGALVDEAWETPLLFEIGDGQLDPCLEACVVEAQIGQLQTFLLTADKAFGTCHDEAIQVLNRNDFPQDMKIELDTAVEFKTPTDESYVGCIEKIESDDITVNFNHPLAGCDVSFQVKVLEKNP